MLQKSTRLLRYSSSEGSLDLALEEALQLGLEEGTSPPTWRVWQAATPAIVLGTGQELLKEVDLDAARAAGVPVLRRHSGGGAVLIGPGVINYSGFFRIAELPGAETISGAMEAALQSILKTLELLAANNSKFKIQNSKFLLAGLSDIAVASTPPFEGGEYARHQTPDYGLKKLAGHAQARKRVSVLVHGTLLADPDWELLERLLKFPSRPPEYRGARGHREFLTSLRELGLLFDLQEFTAALRQALGLSAELAQAPTAAEAACASRLLAEKYSRDEWNLRR